MNSQLERASKLRHRAIALYKSGSRATQALELLIEATTIEDELQRNGVQLKPAPAPLNVEYSTVHNWTYHVRVTQEQRAEHKQKARLKAVKPEQQLFLSI